MYRQMATSCGLERLSSVKSSLKILQTLMISSCEGDSPVVRTCDKKSASCRVGQDRCERTDQIRTLRKNSANSSLCALSAEIGNPVSFRVWRRKLLTSFRVDRRVFAFASLAD